MLPARRRDAQLISLKEMEIWSKIKSKVQIREKDFHKFGILVVLFHHFSLIWVTCLQKYQIFFRAFANKYFATVEHPSSSVLLPVVVVVVVVLPAGNKFCLLVKLHTKRTACLFPTHTHTHTHRFRASMNKVTTIQFSILVCRALRDKKWQNARDTENI